MGIFSKISQTRRDQFRVIDKARSRKKPTFSDGEKQQIPTTRVWLLDDRQQIKEDAKTRVRQAYGGRKTRGGELQEQAILEWKLGHIPVVGENQAVEINLRLMIMAFCNFAVTQTRLVWKTAERNQVGQGRPGWHYYQWILIIKLCNKIKDLIGWFYNAE